MITPNLAHQITYHINRGGHLQFPAITSGNHTVALARFFSRLTAGQEERCHIRGDKPIPEPLIYKIQIHGAEFAQCKILPQVKKFV
jgi:hypothetical protein